MWNPLIPREKAVANSLIMDSQENLRNVILTGLNAGGKSTFITGITLTILLAQTLSITTAQSVALTPFNRINTYIKLADDIAEGKSLFLSEVDRAQNHLETIAHLQLQEFSFSIMDELFSGTNPLEGEAAAYSISHYMARYKNSLVILATPFLLSLSIMPRKMGL